MPTRDSIHSLVAQHEQAIGSKTQTLDKVMGTPLRIYLVDVLENSKSTFRREAARVPPLPQNRRSIFLLSPLGERGNRVRRSHRSAACRKREHQRSRERTVQNWPLTPALSPVERLYQGKPHPGERGTRAAARRRKEVLNGVGSGGRQPHHQTRCSTLPTNQSQLNPASRPQCFKRPHF